MDNLIYILFISVMAPLLLMLILIRGRSKVTLGYMILGMFLALFMSEVTGFIMRNTGEDYTYMTTTITPIMEEAAKALPVLYYACFFSDKKSRIINLAFATGVGFAIFENMVVLLQNIDQVTILWAIARGFSTALMHGVCTSSIGFCIGFVRKKRKLFYTGTFALLTLASIYHGIYNMLVLSEQYKLYGFILPVVTYMILLLYQLRFYKEEKTAKE